MGHSNMAVNTVIIMILCANAAHSFSLHKDVFNNYRFRREATVKTAEVNTTQGSKVADGQEIGTVTEKGMLESTHLSDSHMGQTLTAGENQQGIATWRPQNYFDHHRGGDQFSKSDYHGNHYDSGHTSEVTPDPDLQHEATPDPDLHHEATPDPDLHHEATRDPDLHHEHTPDPDLQQEVTPDPDMIGSDHSQGSHNPLFMSRPGESAPLALPLMSPEHGEHQIINQEQQSRNQQGGEVQNSGGQEGNHYQVKYQEHVSEGHKMPQALAMTGHREAHGEQAPIERDAPVALAQKAKAQRPRPDWSQGTGTKRQTARTGSPSGTTQAPNMFNNMVAMRAMGGGDMMQRMMKMQMYQNPQYMKQYQEMYRQMFPNLFPGNSETGSGGESGSGGQGQLPMGAMYAMGGEDGFMNPMGGDINMQSLYMAQQCQKTPDAPMCKMSQWGMPMGMNMGMKMGMGPMGMMGETQIEGPMGEMDIEPMEMDIEGPMAYQLLKRLNMGPKNVHPHHQEITLNQHVFKALRTRFGVNTTAAIQAKSSDPKLSAFLFQVLEASHQVAPGEYHANLTQAQVNKILAGLDRAATGNNRMPPNNLDHAMIAKDSSNRPVLTLDNPSQPNTPFGALPLAAQPGTFQALVQSAMGITTKAPVGEVGEGVGGEGAEAAEAPEKKTATKPAENKPPAQQSNGTVNTNAQTATTKQNTPTPTRGTIQTGQTAIVGTPGVAAGSAVAGTPIGSQSNNLDTFGTPIQQFGAYNGNTAATGAEKKGKDQEIRNKDGIPGLSKDARNKAFGKMDKANTNMMPVQPATQLPNQIVTDQRSIGMQEAGIFPGANNTVPIKKAETGYTTSTAFAIAAIVLIALMIIIGPILCMLCKMREKRQERNRKLRALKNREVSENNIMEAMMLHEFGATGKNSFSNEGATGGNYYKNEQTRYDTIDPEIECLNRSHPLP